MKKLICIFITLLLSSAMRAGSQTLPASLRFRHYTVEHGLNSNTVRSVLQSSEGYIWIGTDYGLNRFDGIEFTDYSCDGPLNPGSRAIYAMLEDHRGTIWLSTNVGLFSFLPSEDKFRALHTKSDTGQIVSSIVYGIVQDKDMDLWFASYGQGIFRYDIETDELAQYELPQCDNMMLNVFVDSDNTVWATGNPADLSTLFRLNRNTDRFEPFPLTFSGGGRPSNAISIYEDSSRNLWLGTWDGGLQKFDRYSGEVTTLLSSAGGEGGVLHIHSINEYSHGILLVGSDDGLSLLNTVTGEHKLFFPKETDPYSISNRFVYQIVKDREGGLWIGTYYGGVNYISPRSGQFESFIHSDHANSIFGTVISCFSEDRHGNIWIGSDDGGLSRYSPGTGAITNYRPRRGETGLSSGNVHALCFDGDDLWIGTYGGGLNVMDTRTGRFRLYTSSQDENTIDDNSIYSLFRDREGNIWAGTTTGVNLYDRESDRFMRVMRTEANTADIEQDAGGDLWFATAGKGVLRHTPGTRDWRYYQHDSGNGTTIPGNTVNCIHTDPGGEVWIGTTGGLCRYDPQADNFVRIDLGVANQNISCIIREGRQLWITTIRGLVRYVPGEPATVFSQTDGLQSDHFLADSGMKSSSGKIYIGSVNGFNAFYPHRIHLNTFRPPVALTGLKLSNRNVAVAEGGILPVPLGSLGELHLPHDSNMFNIHYAGLSYSNPAKNRYAYMLEGFDREWNHVGTQNYATYTNLPAGSYTFRVKASNNDGIWNDVGASLPITIHPPFYLTLGFKVLYVLLICLASILLFRLLMKHTERRRDLRIEESNRKREKSVQEAKINFFTMIAHEIRTPVSLIMGPLEKIMADGARQVPGSIRGDMDAIERNSQRLLALVNQLLDFRKIDDEGLNFKYERCDLAELIRTIGARFEPALSGRGVKFTVDCPDDGAEAVVDREALTKLVSNLLTNADKYTKDEVILSCRHVPGHENFTIAVTDNGCGIDEEDREKIFDPFYQSMEHKPGTGLGLSIVHNIVKAHGGTIELFSEPGKGSSFLVTLPTEHLLTGYSEMSGGYAAEILPEDILSASPFEEKAHSRRVMLIVDDNAEMLHFLSESLSDRYTVITAGDGGEALLKLKENAVDLIVSDLMMPNMDGIELCRAVRADLAFSHIPFIILTAKSDAASKAEGMDCGADIFIEKPFSFQYLRSCIKNLIEMRDMLYQKFSKMPMVPFRSIAANTADERFLTRMNEIIEENFPNPDLSIDFLAEQLCISRSGLFAKIKTLANVTPNDLIQVVRLKKAAMLLAENRYRVNEISYMVGFNNPSYFTKCFQKQFGVKPGEFLKGGRKKV